MERATQFQRLFKNQLLEIQTFQHPFNSHLLSTYCESDIMLGTRDIQINKTQVLLWSRWWSSVRDWHRAIHTVSHAHVDSNSGGKGAAMLGLMVSGLEKQIYWASSTEASNGPWALPSASLSTELWGHQSPGGIWEEAWSAGPEQHFILNYLQWWPLWFQLSSGHESPCPLQSAGLQTSPSAA
jgi:hypothetical protein